MSRLRQYMRRRGRIGRLPFKLASTRLSSRLGRRKSRKTFRPGFDRTSGYFTKSNNFEKKFHDIATTDAVIAATWSFTAALLTIAQGTGESQRIGRKITITNIGWRFNFELPTSTAATQSADLIRMMLILDKQCNGAAPSVADVLEEDLLIGFNNLSNRKRFRTLMDRSYEIGANGMAGDGTANDTALATIQDTFWKKCNIPIEYSGTAGTITEIKSNNILCLVVTTNGLAGLDGRMRFRYTDN